MERMMVMRSMWRATRGRCSLIRMPGALVGISRKGPPLAWPGLRSKVSVWLGPPLIHSRMHDRRRCGLAVASAANVSIQPDSE
jgi:hypothetical protein